MKRILIAWSVISVLAHAAVIDETKFAQILSQAIQIQTISKDEGPAPVKELRAFHAFVAKQFPKVHATLERTLVGESLLYRWKGKGEGRPVLFLSHFDVVPVPEETLAKWSYPPFRGDIAEGFVWGRGALDDKCGVIGLLASVENLLEAGFSPTREIYFAFGHDEEIGGTGAVQIAKQLKEKGVRAEFLLDEGGLISDGIIKNLTKPVALIGVSEKGYLSLELIATAAGGHSSRPAKNSAIAVLAKALTRIEDNDFPSRLTPPVKEMVEALAPFTSGIEQYVMKFPTGLAPVIRWGFSKEPASSASIRTTVAPTILQAGVKMNVVPTQAKAIINLRLLPGDTIEYAIGFLTKLLSDLPIEIKRTGPGSEASPVANSKSDGFQLIKATINSVYPDIAVSPYLTIGATDARHYSEVADNAFRFLPLRFEKTDLGRYHGIDERVAVADLGRALRFYGELLRKL